MFKEVLQIVPKLDSNDLNKMESSLGRRFTNVAKKFGKGMVDGLLKGGFLAAGEKILDKLLNPLKEVQEAIDKTLHAGDELAEQAKEFNTTAGSLAKLQAFGKTKGLDAEEVNQLIRKFQGKVADAIANPEQDSAVRKFVGQKDTAQGFLTFMENLGKLGKSDKNKQIAVEQDVFGERVRGKAAAFVNADFEELDRTFKKFDTAKLTKSVETIQGLGEQENKFTAIRGLQDLGAKGAALENNPNIAKGRNDLEQLKLDAENAKISQFDNLAALQKGVDGLLTQLETQGLPQLGKLAKGLGEAVEWLRRIAGSPLLKRFGVGGKDE